MQDNLVSIIMPSYNAERFIGKAIDSVLSQTYEQWELIIIDDFSSDSTRKIILDYQEKDDRIKTSFLEENKGAANARNKGLDLAEGEFIAFLDSDDIWYSRKLEKQISYMQANNYSFTSTSYSKIDEKGNTLNEIIKVKNKNDYWGILKTCPGNSTVIYNSKKLGKHNIPLIRKRNDYVLWLKIIKISKYIHGLDEILGSHRIVSSSLSSNKFDLVKYHWKVYRQIEELSLIKSIYLIFYWVFMTVFNLR